MMKQELSSTFSNVIPLRGLNFSLVALALAFTVGQGENNVKKVLQGGQFLDLLLVAFLFSLPLLLGIAVYLNQKSGTWGPAGNNVLARAETLIGLAGVAVLGAFGKSPGLVLGPVLISLFLQKRLQSSILIAAAAAVSNYATNLNDQAVDSIVFAVGILLCIIETIGLKRVSTKLSLKSFFDTSLIVSFILFLIWLSPLSLIGLPVFVLLAHNGLPVLNKYMARKDRKYKLTRKLNSVVSRRTRERVFVLFIRVAKTVAALGLLMFILANYFAWLYDGDPGVSSLLNIKVDWELAPLTSGIFQWIRDKIVESQQVLILLVDVLRPSKVLSTTLKILGLNGKRIQESPEGLLEKTMFLIHSVLGFLERIVSTFFLEALFPIARFAQDIVYNLFRLLVEFANFLINISNRDFSQLGKALVGFVYDLLLTALKLLIRLVLLVFSYVLKKGTVGRIIEGIEGSMTDMLDSITDSLSSWNKYLFGGLENVSSAIASIIPKPLEDIWMVVYKGVSSTGNTLYQVFGQNPDTAVPNTPMQPLQPHLEPGGATPTLYYFLLPIVQVFLAFISALLGGYAWTVTTTLARTGFSEKTFGISASEGVILPVTPPSWAVEEVIPIKMSEEYQDFYSRFMMAYCEKADVLSHTLEPGKYASFLPKYLNSRKRDYGNPQIEPKYSFLQDSIDPASMFNRVFSDIGMSPSFSEEERNLLLRNVSIFPQILSKTESEDISRLKEELKKCEAFVNRPENIQKEFWAYRLLEKLNPVNKQRTAMNLLKNAKEELAQAYTDFYYRFLVLSEYFLDEVMFPLEIQLSATEVFDKIVENLGQCPLEYLEQIIKVRTAIINKELPFLTERQAAIAFLKETFPEVHLRILMSELDKQENGLKPGEIMEIVAGAQAGPNGNEKASSNAEAASKLLCITSHQVRNPNPDPNNGLTREFSIRTNTSTQNSPKKVSVTEIMQKIDLSIGRGSTDSDTVVLITVNGHPVFVQCIPRSALDNLTLSLNLSQDQIKSLPNQAQGTEESGSQKETSEVALYIYSDHVGLFRRIQ